MKQKDNVIKLKAAPIVIKGVKYIPVEMAAQSIGVEITTMYRTKMKKEGPQAYKYHGTLYYEEAEVEQYKMSQMKPVSA